MSLKNRLLEKIKSERKKEYMKIWRSKNRGHIKEYKKKYKQLYKMNYGITPKKEWQLRNPEKDKASDAIRHAVNRGKIQKPELCEKCGKQAMLHGHHDDYSDRFNVQWLCPRCHTYLHIEKESKSAIWRY